MKKTFKKIAAAALAAAISIAAALPAAAVTPSYSVSNAYASSRYYDSLTEVTLTGNYRADLINVALSQLGYHEGAGRSDRNGMNMTSDGNYTEYGYYCECDGYAWCAMFVSWCARQARIPERVIANSRVARAPYFNVEFRWKADYTPQSGDIIFFAEEGEQWSHVGIVLGVFDDMIYTVEGNSLDMVRMQRYKPDDEYIKGYGVYSSEDCAAELVSRDNIVEVRYDFNGGEGKRRTQFTTLGAPLGIYKNSPHGLEEDEEIAEVEDNRHYIGKEGCDFMGWFVQRESDGKWLTEDYGWQAASDILENLYVRQIIEDNATVIFDREWSEEDFAVFTFYAVWANSLTGLQESSTAFIYEYDADGWANTFRDVSPASGYYEAVKTMVQKGLMNGVEEGLFGVDENLTKAQYMVLLYRICGEPENADAQLPFADVSKADWFYSAVNWAYGNGIISEAERLEPGKSITREEAAQYLYSFAVNTGKTEPVSDENITLKILRSLLSFSDISNVAPSCLEAMVWVEEMGLFRTAGIVGREQLLPKAALTRAECCELLNAYFCLVA